VRVAHLDTGRTWRGGQQQVLLLLDGLRRRGVESLLLAPDGPLLERARAAGHHARPWNAHGEWDAGAVIAAARTLRAFGPDVAHLHSAHAHALGILAARFGGRPAVVVSRRVDFAVAVTPWSRLKYRLPVDRYFCISRGVMEVMRRGGIPEHRLALVPSGVAFATEAEVRAAPDLRAALGLAPGTPLVGTVAALAPHKNHADLLRAAARVCAARGDVHFVWFGEGECRAAVERERRALRLESRVHLLGFRPEARGSIPQFTIFALSSYLEGLCTSIIDAQSLGVPVVATETGGIPDLVEDGRSGRLVPPRDPEALARALLEVLGDPGAARRRAEEAARRVEGFSAERMVERSYEEYLRLPGVSRV
jgi:glycosyltransferase involved in cell wall biosynthesis